MASDDAPALFQVTGDPEVMRYWAPGPDMDVAAAARRIAAIEAHWRSHGFGDLAVVERHTGELIGFSGLHFIPDMEEVNVGYALRRDRWRLGYGQEVCRAALALGFRGLGLEVLVAVIAPQNRASIALAERCGLAFWKAITWQGRDRVVYRMTRDTWASGGSAPVAGDKPPRYALRRPRR